MLGKYVYQRTVKYEEYEMPSAMHELSRLSVRFKSPVASRDKKAWEKGTFAESMNEPAKALQKYCTDAGMTPLASDWWHF